MAKSKGKSKSGKMTSLDVMTILGWVIGIGLIIFGIVFSMPPKQNGTPEENAKAMAEYKAVDLGKILSFIDYPSVAITIGGTCAALMVAFPISSFGKIGKHLKIAILPTKYDSQSYIDQIVMFAKEARMKGLLSLEDKLNETEDAFLKSSLMLVVDSVEPEKVHDLLEVELDHMDERHANDRAFYDKGGAFAPGFGMIGTLIGLINMLGKLDDPSTLGPNMAVALLTTLYGSMLANLFFSPISNKLKTRHDEEFLCKVLICEGVEAIQAGENPKFIEEKLQKLVIATKSKKGKKGKKGKEAPAEDE
ncbi:MAG: MotA/TolQ/ExbB proton channel family protein [Hydrogenoanaerobacterium sp.]